MKKNEYITTSQITSHPFVMKGKERKYFGEAYLKIVTHLKQNPIYPDNKSFYITLKLNIKKILEEFGNKKEAYLTIQPKLYDIVKLMRIISTNKNKHDVKNSKFKILDLQTYNYWKHDIKKYDSKNQKLEKIEESIENLKKLIQNNEAKLTEILKFLEKKEEHIESTPTN